MIHEIFCGVFGVAKGRSLAFCIDVLRRHLNTIALPCERVIDDKNN